MVSVARPCVSDELWVEVQHQAGLGLAGVQSALQLCRRQPLIET